MQIEMKSITSSTKQNVRFRSNESVEKVRLDERKFQFLYKNGDSLEVMDQETYDQMTLDPSLLGEALLPLLREGMEVAVEMHDEKPLLMKLPETEVYEIEDCEVAIKGQTVTSSYKPAIVNGGARVMVPPFINIGDRIIVRTETQEYVEREK